MEEKKSKDANTLSKAKELLGLILKMILVFNGAWYICGWIGGMLGEDMGMELALCGEIAVCTYLIIREIKKHN